MATRNRIKRRKAPSPKQSRPVPALESRSDIHAILGRLSDSISLVATAANAFVGAEERAGTAQAATVGDEIVALTHGVCCLRRAYDEMDVALRAVEP
jgi:hypothetical protein